MKQLIYQIH